MDFFLKKQQKDDTKKRVSSEKPRTKIVIKHDANQRSQQPESKRKRSRSNKDKPETKGVDITTPPASTSVQNNLTKKPRLDSNTASNSTNNAVNAEEQAAKIACTIHVSGIDAHVTEEQLFEFFSDCGNVVNYNISDDVRSHPPRFALFEFANANAAMTAVTLSGSMLGSTALRISMAKTTIQTMNPKVAKLNETIIAKRSLRTIEVSPSRGGGLTETNEDGSPSSSLPSSANRGEQKQEEVATVEDATMPLPSTLLQSNNIPLLFKELEAAAKRSDNQAFNKSLIDLACHIYELAVSSDGNNESLENSIMPHKFARLFQFLLNYFRFFVASATTAKSSGASCFQVFCMGNVNVWRLFCDLLQHEEVQNLLQSRILSLGFIKVFTCSLPALFAGLGDRIVAKNHSDIDPAAYRYYLTAFGTIFVMYQREYVPESAALLELLCTTLRETARLINNVLSSLLASAAIKDEINIVSDIACEVIMAFKRFKEKHQGPDSNLSDHTLKALIYELNTIVSLHYTQAHDTRYTSNIGLFPRQFPSIQRFLKLSTHVVTEQCLFDEASLREQLPLKQAPSSTNKYIKRKDTLSVSQNRQQDKLCKKLRELASSAPSHVAPFLPYIALLFCQRVRALRTTQRLGSQMQEGQDNGLDAVINDKCFVFIRSLFDILSACLNVDTWSVRAELFEIISKFNLLGQAMLESQKKFLHEHAANAMSALHGVTSDSVKGSAFHILAQIMKFDHKLVLDRFDQIWVKLVSIKTEDHLPLGSSEFCLVLLDTYSDLRMLDALFKQQLEAIARHNQTVNHAFLTDERIRNKLSHIFSTLPAAMLTNISGSITDFFGSHGRNWNTASTWRVVPYACLILSLLALNASVEEYNHKALSKLAISCCEKLLVPLFENYSTSGATNEQESDSHLCSILQLFYSIKTLLHKCDELTGSMHHFKYNPHGGSTDDRAVLRKIEDRFISPLISKHLGPSSTIIMLYIIIQHVHRLHQELVVQQFKTLVDFDPSLSNATVEEKESILKKLRGERREAILALIAALFKTLQNCRQQSREATWDQQPYGATQGSVMVALWKVMTKNANLISLYANPQQLQAWIQFFLDSLTDKNTNQVPKSGDSASNRLITVHQLSYELLQDQQFFEIIAIRDNMMRVIASNIVALMRSCINKLQPEIIELLSGLDYDRQDKLVSGVKDVLKAFYRSSNKHARAAGDGQAYDNDALERLSTMLSLLWEHFPVEYFTEDQLATCAHLLLATDASLSNGYHEGVDPTVRDHLQQIICNCRKVQYFCITEQNGLGQNVNEAFLKYTIATIGEAIRTFGPSSLTGSYEPIKLLLEVHKANFGSLLAKLPLEKERAQSSVAEDQVTKLLSIVLDELKASSASKSGQERRMVAAKILSAYLKPLIEALEKRHSHCAYFKSLGASKMFYFPVKVEELLFACEQALGRPSLSQPHAHDDDGDDDDNNNNSRRKSTRRQRYNLLADFTQVECISLLLKLRYALASPYRAHTNGAIELESANVGGVLDLVWAFLKEQLLAAPPSQQQDEAHHPVIVEDFCIDAGIEFIHHVCECYASFTPRLPQSSLMQLSAVIISLIASTLPIAKGTADAAVAAAAAADCTNNAAALLERCHNMLCKAFTMLVANAPAHLRVTLADSFLEELSGIITGHGGIVSLLLSNNENDDDNGAAAGTISNLLYRIETDDGAQMDYRHFRRACAVVKCFGVIINTVTTSKDLDRRHVVNLTALIATAVHLFAKHRFGNNNNNNVHAQQHIETHMIIPCLDIFMQLLKHPKNFMVNDRMICLVFHVLISLLQTNINNSSGSNKGGSSARYYQNINNRDEALNVLNALLVATHQRQHQHSNNNNNTSSSSSSNSNSNIAIARAVSPELFSRIANIVLVVVAHRYNCLHGELLHTFVLSVNYLLQSFIISLQLHRYSAKKNSSSAYDLCAEYLARIYERIASWDKLVVYKQYFLEYFFIQTTPPTATTTTQESEQQQLEKQQLTLSSFIPAHIMHILCYSGIFHILSNVSPQQHNDIVVRLPQKTKEHYKRLVLHFERYYQKPKI